MFSRDFQLFGPEARPGSPLSLREAKRYCRKLAKRHYENFTVASWLLPGRLRQHFYNVYAYCRWADDLADETGDPQTKSCFAGLVGNATSRLLSWASRSSGFYCPGRNIRKFKIPIDPFLDLLAAFQAGSTCKPLRDDRSIIGILPPVGQSGGPFGAVFGRVLFDRACRAGRFDLHRTAIGQFLPGRGRRLGSGPDLSAPGRLPPLRIYRGHVRPARVQRGISPADDRCRWIGRKVFCVPGCRS